MKSRAKGHSRAQHVQVAQHPVGHPLRVKADAAGGKVGPLRRAFHEGQRPGKDGGHSHEGRNAHQSADEGQPRAGGKLVRKTVKQQKGRDQQRNNRQPRI